MPEQRRAGQLVGHEGLRLTTSFTQAKRATRKLAKVENYWTGIPKSNHLHFFPAPYYTRHAWPSFSSSLLQSLDPITRLMVFQVSPSWLVFELLFLYWFSWNSCILLFILCSCSGSRSSFSLRFFVFFAYV